METETTEISIDRPADVVWPFIGDFAGLTWMPGVDSVTLDGDVRTVSMGGTDILERLNSVDDDARRRISYSIIGGPVPLDEHESVITVTPDGDGCRVEWAVSSSPDGTAGFLRDIYAGALQALKAKAEADDA